MLNIFKDKNISLTAKCVYCYIKSKKNIMDDRKSNALSIYDSLEELTRLGYLSKKSITSDDKTTSIKYDVINNDKENIS